METVEKVIEGENVERVRHIGTVAYKSDKDGFKDKTFERYTYQGETFRVKSDEVKFIESFNKGEIYKIWLILRKDVQVGLDDKGNPILRDLWEYDGHINEKSAKSKAQTKAIIERIKLGVDAVAELPELEEAG